MNEIICQCSTFGLGNKLLFIASSMRVCELLNRPMIIQWDKSEHCDCLFNDLFEPIEGVKSIQKLPENLKTINEEAIVPQDIPEGQCVLSHTGFVHLQGEQKTFPNLSMYFNKIRPIKSIANDIDKIVGKHDFKNTVGLHYRGTDYGECPWKIRYFETCKATIQRFPNVKFFLAADNPEITNEFIEEFGDKIIVYPKTSWTEKLVDKWYPNCPIYRSQQCMAEATVDMWLLASCAVIVGGVGTFPACATKIKNAPLTSITMKNNILFLTYKQTEPYKVNSVNDVVNRIAKIIKPVV